MKTGKLPEHTFKRAVLNPIWYRNRDFEFRAAVGHDGAVIGDMVTSMSTTAFYYEGNELYALQNALNNIIAAGGKPYGIAVAVLLPEHSEEAVLRKITGNISKKAALYEIEILAGHTELVPTVSLPTITITAYGSVLWNNRHKEVTEDMDIVMTKWTGLYGGAILADLKKDELIGRYPRSYIETAAEYINYTSLMPELAVIQAFINEHPKDIYAAHDVSNGGVFGALWQMLSACNIGAECRIRDILMKQEIIEICEYFDINPYMLNGQGSILMILKDGTELVEMMHEADIEASVIGKTQSGSGRKVLVGDEERFLVPPKGDALNVVFYGQKMPV